MSLALPAAPTQGSVTREEFVALEESLLTPEGRYQQHAVTSAPTRRFPLLFLGWSLDLAEAQAEISEETEDEAAPK